MFRKRMNDDDILLRLQKIKSSLDSDPGGIQDVTGNLRKSDFALIGKVVQIYCFSDLNARRIIDVIRYAAFGPETRCASSLSDGQVLPMFHKLVSGLWESNIKNGLLKVADALEMHRIHRHDFAHWAARRVLNEDALILFTKNFREAERRDGQSHGPEEAKYAIIYLPSLREEVKKLEGHGKYLALAAAHFETNFEELRQRLLDIGFKNRIDSSR